MEIHGLQKLTLLDYPGTLGCTLFSGYCNFRCPFCQNKNLVLHPETEPVICWEEILCFLKKRQGILEGVCFTGGEPTLQPDLAERIREVKQLGFKVKLDTNGYRPNIIRELLKEELLDYIAMDIKNCPERYARTAGCGNLDFSRIQESVSIITRSGISYEFRTTVMREFHDREAFMKIGEWLRGAESYYLQAYRDSETVIHPGFTSYTAGELEQFAEMMGGYGIRQTGVRGIS